MKNKTLFIEISIVIFLTMVEIIVHIALHKDLIYHLKN